MGVSAGLFLRYLYLPPGPTAVGSGGIFSLFLFIFPAAPVYHFLKLYNGVTVMRDWSLLRHCTRLNYSVAVSAQSYQSVIVRQLYHRVVSSVLRDAQT